MADRKYPRHDFWGAGEPDCPADLKAPNGWLMTEVCRELLASTFQAPSPQEAADGVRGLQGAEAGRAFAQRLMSDPGKKQLMQNLKDGDGVPVAGKTVDGGM